MKILALNSIKIVFLIVFTSCKSQKVDSTASYLSSDFYRSFNFENSNPDKEKKYQLWNWTYKKYDTVYDIKPDEKLYAIIDSIPPVELTKNQVNKIHFWTHEDFIKLNNYYKIDSLMKIIENGNKLSKEGWNLISLMNKHYLNYYIVEKVGNKYYKYKVFRRRRVVE